MLERVIRAMMAIGMVPSAREGRIRCFRLSPRAGMLPVMRLSMR